jgi:polyisoprenoid-binding protein YceI
MSLKELAMAPTTSVPPSAADGCWPRTLGRYAIDTARSRVEVRARCLGLPVGGVYDGVAGAIDVPTDLTASAVSVTVDPSSLRTTGGPLGKWLRTSIGDEPTSLARFDAVRMEPILESFVTHDGDRPLWALVGTLTLHGTSRTVRIAIGVVRSVDSGASIAFSGSTVLRCSDFEIPRARGLLGDTLRVTITGVATRETC